MSEDTYTIKPFEWVTDSIYPNRYYMVNSDYYVALIGPEANPLRFDVYEYQENGEDIYITSEETLEKAKARAEGYMRNNLLYFLEKVPSDSP